MTSKANCKLLEGRQPITQGKFIVIVSHTGPFKHRTIDQMRCAIIAYAITLPYTITLCYFYN